MYSMKLGNPPATTFANAKRTYSFTLNSTMISNATVVNCLFQIKQEPMFQQLSSITVDQQQNTIVSCSLNNRSSFTGNTDQTIVTLVAMTSNTSYIVISNNNYTIVHFPGNVYSTTHNCTIIMNVFC